MGTLYSSARIGSHTKPQCTVGGVEAKARTARLANAAWGVWAPTERRRGFGA